MPDDDEDPIATHTLDAFDAGTTVDVYEDGTLFLTFPLMPPSWWKGKDALESLGDDLAETLETEVEWADKELFIISPPPAGTEQALARLRDFLAELRARNTSA
jgi:hypothetical protein